jgi:GT2 family glycosyltransferase
MTGGGRVSAVMVTYHTGPALFGAVEAVLGQEALGELILVDNGNPQPVVAALQRLEVEQDRVELLSGHGNIGCAAGCNLGAAAARGNHLLFVNPDCLLPPGALTRFLEAARRTPRPAVFGARLSNADGTEQRGSRRGTLTPWTAVVEALRLDRLIPGDRRFARLNRHEQPVPADAVEVPVVSGACMFTALADFRALGGFDEGYFLHVDDIDFCFRMRRAGGQVVFLPQIPAVHYRSSSRAHPVIVEWHKARGFMRYFRKNFSASHGRLLIGLTNLAVVLRFAVKAGWLAARGPWHKAAPGPMDGKVQGPFPEVAERQPDPGPGKRLANPNSTTGRPA